MLRRAVACLAASCVGAQHSNAAGQLTIAKAASTIAEAFRVRAPLLEGGAFQFASADCARAVEIFDNIVDVAAAQLAEG